MSGASESLKRRIVGAQDLASVVRSMKALAASSIGQYERAVASLVDYHRAVQQGLGACLRAAAAAPAARPTPHPALGLVIFGSDQGLVGRFNEVLVDFVRHALETTSGRVKRIWAVGDRITELATDSAWAPVVGMPVPGSVDAIAPLASGLLIAIETARERDALDEIIVFYNRSQADERYVSVGERLWPVDAPAPADPAAPLWPTHNLPEVIGEREAVLADFMREYLFVLLFRACAESLASENAARLAAMQRAERNIDDIRADLKHRYQRVRQDSIDEELFDVVSGYESQSAEIR